MHKKKAWKARGKKSITGRQEEQKLDRTASRQKKTRDREALDRETGPAWMRRSPIAPYSGFEVSYSSAYLLRVRIGIR